MQKVSKQSLAMIALSILLAISIALTFTFAFASDSKKATGTITFSGSASVAWAADKTLSTTKYEETTEGITINLTDADFDFKVSGEKTIATIKTSVVSDEFSKVTVAIKNNASSSLTWKIEVAQDTDKKISLTEVTDLTKTGTLDGVTENTGKEKVVKLSEIISSISVADVDAFGATGVSFTITASIAPATNE